MVVSPETRDIITIEAEVGRRSKGIIIVMKTAAMKMLVMDTTNNSETIGSMG